MFKRKKRQVPSLNTTSTADISFMLLIFFLVTSSMDVDKGLSRLLPPLTPEEQQQKPTDVDERNVLQLHILADGTLTCNNQPLAIGQLQSRVETFVGSEAERLKHIIQIDADREASYDTYFQVQDAIVSAYRHLRDQQARRQFGMPMSRCSAEQQEMLRSYYPQRVAEVNNSYAATGDKQRGTHNAQRGGES